MPKKSKQTSSSQRRPRDPALAGSYLIRISSEQDFERAFTAFLHVPAARVVFPGNIMGVTEDHVRVLEEEGIPFEYVSKAPHGEEDPPV